MYVIAEAVVNTIRIIQKIESNDIHIDGLDKYKGKDAEIIVLIEDVSDNDKENRKQRGDKFISEYSGKIKNWNRDELYDR